MKKEEYEHVWQMMDACNASGVLHSISNRVVPYVWEEVRAGEWPEFNTHPLLVICYDKLNQLAGIYNFDAKDHDKTSKSYEYVLDKMKG